MNSTSPAWPDPPPKIKTNADSIWLDDVSRMSSTKVRRLGMPHDEEDVIALIKDATAKNCKISCRGTKHSMGGQTLLEDCLVIDTAYLRFMEYNNNEDTITCGPGCLWSDLIVYLDKYGRSPCVMQSYCTFSIGGTLAVNAHGITSDDCIAKSVLSMNVILSNGEVHTTKQGEELFSLVIGGYGLYGIVTSVTLSVSPNHNLSCDPLLLSLSNGDFERVYRSILLDPTVDVKIARFNILDGLQNAQLIVFKKKSIIPVASSTLGLEARDLSMKSKILYKWVMPALLPLRYAIEENLGQAFDMTSENDDSITRNELMFESAVPLAKLYTKFFKSDDTFVLQEYFGESQK